MTTAATAPATADAPPTHANSDPCTVHVSAWSQMKVPNAVDQVQNRSRRCCQKLVITIDTTLSSLRSKPFGIASRSLPRATTRSIISRPRSSPWSMSRCEISLHAAVVAAPWNASPASAPAVTSPRTRIRAVPWCVRARLSACAVDCALLAVAHFAIAAQEPDTAIIVANSGRFAACYM